MNLTPRIALFGLECGFTATTLQVLLHAGVKTVAIFLPGPPHYDGVISATHRSLPVIGPTDAAAPTVSAIAGQHSIPLMRVGDLRTERTRRQVLEHHCDLIVVACFNRKLPTSLYSAVPLGGVNIHPSLLPELRGPDPLFWTFHDGSGKAGVTVHRLSDRFDAGPILAQTRVAYPDGCDETTLDRSLAGIGSTMLVDMLPRIVAGTQVEWQQEMERRSYASFPTTVDLIVTPQVPARSAFNFARGLAGRGMTIRYQDDGDQVEIVEALGYYDGNWKHPGSPWDQVLDELRFHDGRLLARVRHAGEAPRT